MSEKLDRDSAKIERMLYLLKYRQSELTPAEDAKMRDAFDVSDEIIRQDEADIRNGFSFLGWKIEKTGRQQRVPSYGVTESLTDSRFHPLFFCFNSTEVLVMLESLLATNNPVSIDLASLLYVQLSKVGKEFARKKFPSIETIIDENIKLKNRQESEIYTAKNFDLFFVKPGICKLKIECTGGNMIEGIPEKENGKIFINTKSGEKVELDLKKVIEIKRI